MIRSMTGFGEAQLEADGHTYQVEVRSVNNRYLKTSVRVPEEFAFLEPPLEALLRKRLVRGSVTLKLYVRDLSAGAATDINRAAVQRYVEQLDQIRPGGRDVVIDLATLLTLPGVCQPHELSDAQRESSARLAEQLAGEAVDRLIEMRTVEGRALASDLLNHCHTIRERSAAIRSRAPGAVEVYRDRLLARINELTASSGVQFAEQDLLKEVSIYAERSDVSEELARLDSHLDQFERLIASSEPAGRKLDFIAQELLREANTIGSKAGDSAIAVDVIEIKAAVDRLKEQVQNVE